MRPQPINRNDPNAPRERTPEEARRAAVWKGMGIAAGAGGMLWLAKKSMEMRGTRPYRRGTDAAAGTLLEKPGARASRKMAEQADIAAHRASVSVDRALAGGAEAKDQAIVTEIGRRLSKLPQGHPQRPALQGLQDKVNKRISTRKEPRRFATITPLHVFQFRRNFARAAIEFNLRAEDGTYLPSLDPRTLYNKGRRMVTSVNRSGEVAEDVGDIVAGRPQQPGKKRFYQKSWFRNAALGAALGGGMLYARTRAAKRGEVAPV